MQTADPPTTSGLTWNAGGWFGSLFGCTLWLFILGLALLTKDLPAAATSLVGCALLVTWGWHIWGSRAKRSAYAGLQRFLAGCTLVYTVVILTVNLRGASSPAFDSEVLSTYLPYWALGIAPLMMLVFYLRERSGAQTEKFD